MGVQLFYGWAGMDEKGDTNMLPLDKEMDNAPED